MAKSCTIIIIINLFVLGGAAVFVAWLADRPRFPIFNIDQAAINSFKFTKDNILTVNFIFIVRSHNINSKYNIFYDHLAVSVYHDQYTLAYQTLGPLSENDRRDDIVFTAHPMAKNETIFDAHVAENIRNESKSREINFEVMIRAFVRFEAKGWKRKEYLLKIICFPAVINLHTGKSVKKTKCDLDNYTKA